MRPRLSVRRGADAPGRAGAQRQRQLQAEFAAGLEEQGFVDRLVRHAHAWVVGMEPGEPGTDLPRRPAGARAVPHEIPQPPVGHQFAWFGAGAPGDGAVVRRDRPIGRRAAVAGDLPGRPRSGAARAARRSTDGTCPARVPGKWFPVRSRPAETTTWKLSTSFRRQDHPMCRSHHLNPSQNNARRLNPSTTSAGDDRPGNHDAYEFAGGSYTNPDIATRKVLSDGRLGEPQYEKVLRHRICQLAIYIDISPRWLPVVGGYLPLPKVQVEHGHQ